MDYYHIWCDLKDGVNDVTFCDNVGRYLGHLEDQGLIAGHRLARRKLGLGPDGLGEFHIVIETRDMAHLEQTFQRVAKREHTVETLHGAVYSAVRNLKFALYRDFPDAIRTGDADAPGAPAAPAAP